MAADASKICCPITKLSDVLEWKCVDSCWAKLVRNIEPRTDVTCLGYGRECDVTEIQFHYSRKYESRSAPKTLLCHDMKGGYLEDRYVEGSESHDEYRFFHWAGIDIFVYFSHYLVTVPPLAWINSGHLHGVPVLGTLITEWDEGKAVWLEVLSDENKLTLFSSKLAEICYHYQFDGYLLNVENVIPVELVDRLVEFVKQLKNDLKKTCKHKTLVIWYDSVITPTGELKWQDKLNDRNGRFFDACDGIFLNYCWKEEGLKESIVYAGERVKDVFVGVDVYGRGCFGGGKFNTDMALNVIHSLGLSVAIFAPGWVHEQKPEDEDFLKREYTFWNKLWPYLYTHGPTKLPFSTSFCQGFGLKTYKNGQVVSDTPWYNLSAQQYQPSTCVCECKDEECLDYNHRVSCISYCHEDAFEGGGCLKIHPCSKTHNRLFHGLLICNFSTINPSGFLVTFGIKQLDSKGCLDVVILMEDTAERSDNVGDIAAENTSSEKAIDNSHIVSVTVVNKDCKNFIEYQPQFSISFSEGWESRSFRIYNLGGIMTSRIVELGVVPSEENNSVLFGCLQVKAFPETEYIAEQCA